MKKQLKKGSNRLKGTFERGIMSIQRMTENTYRRTEHKYEGIQAANRSSIMKNDLTYKPKGIVTGQVMKLTDLVGYQAGAVVSREIVKMPKGSITIFSFDKGQGLSEHKAPYDALVQVLEGEAEVSIEGKPHNVEKGEIILMPANQLHALKALKKFKMILTMIHA
jgi:quercetin dioxygenase-like cupin family protein